MKKNMFFILFLFLFNSVFSQIAFKDKDCNEIIPNGDTAYLELAQGGAAEIQFNVFNGYSVDTIYQIYLTHLYLPAGSEGLEVCAAGGCAMPTEPMQIGFDNRSIGANSCEEAHILYYPGTSDEDFYARLKVVNPQDANDTSAVHFIYELPASLKNANSDLITFYPVPADNYVNISYQTEDNQNLEIYNVSGKLIQNISLNFTKGNFYLNVSYLPAGIYIAKIGLERKKFVVTH